MTKTVSEKILENGLCFIVEAIERMNYLEGKDQDVSDKDRSLKYTIFHLFSGVFSILKAKLSEEHWSFLFQSISKSTEQSLKFVDFTGVSFNDCLKRLKDISLISFTDEQNKILDSIRKKRNQAEHFFLNENDPKALKSNSYKTLCLVIDLIDKWFEGKYEDHVTKIKCESRQLKGYIEKRLNIIQPKIEERCKREPDKFIFFPFQCLECWQKTVVYGKDYDCLECLFCDHKIEPETYSDYLWQISGTRQGDYSENICGECNEVDGIVPAENDKEKILLPIDNGIRDKEVYEVSSHCLFCQTMLYEYCKWCNRTLNKNSTQKMIGSRCGQCFWDFLDRKNT